MDYFGYKLLPVTPELVSARRASLDWYANLAQLSQIAVLVFISLFGLIFSSLFRFSKEASVKNSNANLLVRTVRKLEFRLGTEVASQYGTYAQWIFGSLWGAWLLFLCTAETAPDYALMIKRFGIVAASQLPLHYLLAMKHPYSPHLLMLKSSHEVIISWHKVTGKLIITFISVHVSLYINMFVSMNMFWKLAQQTKIVVALLSATIFFAMGITSTEFFKSRKYSYFYALHVFGSAAILPLMWFHVKYIRIYMLECAAVVLANVLLRLYSSSKVESHISTVPGSNDLVEVLVKNPGALAQGSVPGQHVYLRKATAGISSYMSKNPFTIATLPGEDGTVTLIAKKLNGNTKELHAAAIATQSIGRPTTMYLEGPYGHSKHLPDPSKFSRVLFIAGGTGATYILPLWRSYLLARTSNQELRLVWAVRNVGDATWALGQVGGKARKTSAEYKVNERQLRITRTTPAKDKSRTNGSTDVDKQEMVSSAERAGFEVSHGRPDLSLLVDLTISANTGRSAVFVCGPSGMVTNARAMVGKWIEKGEDVYWHAEKFGT